jgi:hypothetical protein
MMSGDVAAEKSDVVVAVYSIQQCNKARGIRCVGTSSESFTE